MENIFEDDMEKSKTYQRTRFSTEVLREAITEFEKIIETVGGEVWHESDLFRVMFPGEKWKQDNEVAFLADYREGIGARLSRNTFVSMNDTKNQFSLDLTMYDYENTRETEISVSALTREQIQQVFEVFEKHAANSQTPEPEDEKIVPTIFIGHGHSQAWRDLKDHLHEKHDYPVEAYETGARAGHTIRDILEKMMSKSAFALLVLTCDDDIGDGKYRARQNVIHEAGLFQGHIGFSRAIVLLEDGVDVEEFSNIAGIHHLSFSKGNIKEIFGEILATIRREFGVQD